MNLWTNSKLKWDLESNSKPEIEEKHLVIKLCPIIYLKLYFPLKLTNSSPEDKVFNFIKINESLN